MKKRIYNLIILDESGSMWSIAKQAVDGVNESIQTIRAAQRKNEDQEHFQKAMPVFRGRSNLLAKRAGQMPGSGALGTHGFLL